jgi:Phage tail lysozyme
MANVKKAAKTVAKHAAAAHGTRWNMSRWTAGETSLFNALSLNTWGLKLPQLSAVLPGEVSKAGPAGGGGSSPTGATPNTGGATGLKGIYNALRSVGFSQNAAIGVMANMKNESSFNVETNAMDTNGARSYGLVSWNAASFPTAPSLVTGNAKADLIRQVQFLVQSGGLRAASGSTAEQAAGNFAANFERCQGCQPGGAQYNARVANVAGIRQSLGLLWHSGG